MLNLNCKGVIKMKCIDIKRIKARLLLIHNKRFKLGLVASIILVVVILISGPGLNQWSQINSKGMPEYFLDKQQFNTAEGARKYIKDLPFIEPPYLIAGYNLKEITYTKSKEMSFSVDFSYEDRSYNTLNIVYTLKGSSNNYERTPFNPNCIKVDTGAGFSQPKGVKITKDNHLLCVINKPFDNLNLLVFLLLYFSIIEHELPLPPAIFASIL